MDLRINKGHRYTDCYFNDIYRMNESIKLALFLSHFYCLFLYSFVSECVYERNIRIDGITVRTSRSQRQWWSHH